MLTDFKHQLYYNHQHLPSCVRRYNTQMPLGRCYDEMTQLVTKPMSHSDRKQAGVPNYTVYSTRTETSQTSGGHLRSTRMDLAKYSA